MHRRWILGAILGALFLTGPVASAADGTANTLAVEGGYFSLSSDYASESPPGSGIVHRGEGDASDPAYGLSFEYRATRHVGVRLGVSWSSFSIDAATECTSTPCEFQFGPARVKTSENVWSVDDDGDLRMIYLEVPFVLQPRENVEIFAGPTLADLDLDGASSSGPNGLIVEVDGSSPAYGLHVGATGHFGWKGRWSAGEFRRSWSAGLIARWIRTDLEYGVGIPVLFGGAELFSTETEEDLLTVGFFLGRRFGGSD